MSVTETESVRDLLAQDRLDDARARLVAEVKANPQAANLRLMLAQVLAVMGDLERAETHARMAQQLAPNATLRLTDLRQTLRAMHARAAFWADGAIPDIPLGPTAADRAALALHSGVSTDPVEPAWVSGTLNGTAFEGLRDLDDRLPHAFEVLSSGGHYLWLDFAKVARVTMAPIGGLLDLIARPARVTLTDGSSADLRLVAVYDSPRDAAEMLGRSTDFTGLSDTLTRAHGQRVFLAGDAMVSLHEIEELTLTHG